eukprot:TRINITY_DN38951_c0_g1_i1.p1 TRINITY_DN38951_c0_g1~~TRINITY_DN38951_c0_g1_i1.p1  ORF type:complete len:365 (-),score=58.76 TRINITY_DN38951_c0_g1_i1:171-1145(-)
MDVNLSSEGQSNLLGLDTLIAEMLEGVHNQGYCSLRVNGSLFCQVCIFPKVEAPSVPSAAHALALVRSRAQLLQELPPDSADIVRCIIEAASPTTSLGELMVRLALPLSTLQRVAQHLVFWKKARVVDVLKDQTRVALASGIDMALESDTAAKFYAWRKGDTSKDKNPELTFSEVVIAFKGGKQLAEVRDHFASGADFQKVLEWLVAQDLLVQLATYCHFLPRRASTLLSSAQPYVHATVKSRFCPHSLTESELLVLASRAKDHHQHLFLCRFAVEFARAHKRVDGADFTAFATRAFEEQSGLFIAERLIAANEDIFVKYVCQC